MNCASCPILLCPESKEEDILTTISVSFDLAYDYPGDKPAHCVASAKSPKKNGLTEFEFMPCETGYKQWSLTRGGPNGQWVFEAINVE